MKNPFEVPDMPDALTHEGWDEWEDQSRRKYPVRFFLSETIPRAYWRFWNRFIHDPWYWLKCRLWYQYNVVRIKTLPPTWMDRDQTLLHAAFQVFVDFVEKEKPNEMLQSWQEHYDDYNYPPAEAGSINEFAKKRADDAQSLKDLYRWWTVERPARKCPYDAITDNKNKDQLLAAGDADVAFENEDTAKLIELCKLRRNLWT